MEEYDSAYDSSTDLSIPDNTNAIINSERSRVLTSSFPMYFQYQLKSDRIKSFRDWPPQMKQKPEEMASAGFFYRNNCDRVSCFSCGISIQGWEIIDTAWGEHQHWCDEFIVRCDYLERSRDILDIKIESKVDEIINETSLPSAISDFKILEDNQVSNPYQCTVCYENKLSVVFKPCGHVATCSDCALNLKSCPICRAQVNKFERVFLP